MESVRLINWCIEMEDEGLVEKWLVRLEKNGSYTQMVSNVHDHLLKKCSIEAAINKVSASHHRPIPYHPIDIVVRDDSRIHNFRPKCEDWEDHTDIPTLVKIAQEIRLVTVSVVVQEKPDGARLNKARCSLLRDSIRSFKNTTIKDHDVAEELASRTGVKATRAVVTEQHEGERSTQSLSARETLNFLRKHACHAHQKNDTLTVYRFHMNREFAHVAQKVICSEILSGKQVANSKPWWSKDGYAFIPNSFFRIVFFTEQSHLDLCPLERVFLEQYFTVPCETGVYNATCAKNVAHIFTRMIPLTKGEQAIIETLDPHQETMPAAAIVDKTEIGQSEVTHDKGKIAVFDYKMFYPHVMYVSSESPAYQRRVQHMCKVRPLLPTLKKVYTKEIGMLALVRPQLYKNMLSLSRTILETLVNTCRQGGVKVLITQTDSVTVRIPTAVMDSFGDSLEKMASMFQKTVMHRHPTFFSELKLERHGTDMIVYGPNKHVLYEGEEVVYRTGFHCKSFCPAMSKTINEITKTKTQAHHLMCSITPCTDLAIFVSAKMREYAVEKEDLVCDSYSLNSLLVNILHVQADENGMFTVRPNLYLALSTYRADNEQTMPTMKSFMQSVMNSLGSSTQIIVNNQHSEQIKRVIETVFTEKMGMVRWRPVLEELREHFTMRTVSFLKGGCFV